MGAAQDGGVALEVQIRLQVIAIGKEISYPILTYP
jgi:hypothetical protein